MTRLWRGALLLALVVGGAVAAGAARADNPRAVTLMTQNIYQGTELEHVLAARTPLQLLLGVATDYENVVTTNFAERAAALAAEIDAAHPAVVGLQEVATWRTEAPFGTGTPTVTYDFLQILLDALAARGLHYAPVVTHVNFVAPAPGAFAPGLFPTGLIGVQLTEQTAIIARTDLPTDELKLSNPLSGAYTHVTTLPTLTGPFALGAGWASVDAKVRGKTVRVITTHLDGFSPVVAGAQADELLAGPGATDLPTVVMGDFNSTTADPAYAEVSRAGFVDEWALTNPGDPGLTCCQVPPDTIVNPVSRLHDRIDYVFARGLLAPLGLSLVGADSSARTPSGLWPSDHAGVVASLEIGPQPGLTP